MFGPSRMKRFGKPGTVQPRCAWGEPSQTSARLCPSRPRTSRPTGMSRTWKPVPKISASTSSSRPDSQHDRVRPDRRDRVGHELDVVARERRIPLVRGQDALAAERVVGRRLGDQLRVLQRALQVAAADLLEQLHPARPLDEAEHQQLARRVDPAAQRPLGGREGLEEPLLQRGDRPRGVRHDPRRRALDHVQLRDVGRDRGHVLDRRGAGADRWRRACPAAPPSGPSGPSGRPGPRTTRARGGPGSSARPAGPCRRRAPSRAPRPARSRSPSARRPIARHGPRSSGAPCRITSSATRSR